LLLPFPQYTGITLTDSQGYQWYHALQVRLERHLSKGLTVQGVYAFSRLMTATTYLNAADPAPYRSLSLYDSPEQIAFSGIYELPIGRGKALLGNAGRAENYLVGGWALALQWQYNSGLPISFGNVIFTGNPNDIPLSGSQRSVQEWFNVNAGFVKTSSQQLANNLRTFPVYLNSIRTGCANDWDVSVIKDVKIYERYAFQFRGEFFNVFNHPFGYLSPSTDPTSAAFGQVTSMNYAPRNIQLAVKFLF
jgi:hypothetical protein